MRLICPKEAATLLGVSVRTAQRLMRQGEIAACKIGKLWRTQAEDVAAYRARAYERYRREGGNDERYRRETHAQTDDL